MSKEGDTSVKNIKRALADNGLILQCVGGKYIRKGGGAISPAEGKKLQNNHKHQAHE